MIDDLYLRCLARPPAEAERQSLVAIVPEGDQRRQVLDDIFWGVSEFPGVYVQPLIDELQDFNAE